MSDEFLPAGDLLEEHGFDEAAKFLKSAVASEDYDDEYDKRIQAEKEAKALQDQVDDFENLISETVSRYEWRRLSSMDHLRELIDEWRERADRIKDLEAELASERASR